MVLYIGKIKTEVHPRALDNILALRHDFKIVEQWREALEKKL